MTSPLAAFQHALAKAVVQSQGLEEDPALLTEIQKQMRIPAPEHGDLSMPCFALAKRRGQGAGEAANIAQEVAKALGDDDRWAHAQAAGPYVNVRYAPKLLAETVVPMARERGFGNSKAGRGKTVVIDFSSPNIAKPLAFHHIRSTVIGAAIGRLHAAHGWDVVGINYLGDWGKQFGLLATGFQRYGDPAKRSDAKHLVEVYVKANRDADIGGRKGTIAKPAKVEALLQEHATLTAELAAGPDKKKSKKLKSTERKLFDEKGYNTQDLRKSDEAQAWMKGVRQGEAQTEWFAALKTAAEQAQAELPQAQAYDEEARAFFKRMEDGDDKALAEWTEFRETSIAEFRRVYTRMGVRFTYDDGGESTYNDRLEQTVEMVRQKPGTEMSDGAEVVNRSVKVKASDKPILLKTSSGTTLYITRDIAAAMDRKARFNFDRSLYVVAADQALHFRELFATLKAMGHDWSDDCAHVDFGRVHGMATRLGKIVFLDEVLGQAVAKAREKCAESEKIDKSRLDETAEAIGIGAVVFGDLQALRQSDYEFNIDEALKFTGHTAPYVQFSHARTCSIIKKGGGVPQEADPSLLTLEEERQVLVALARYPDAVLEACDAQKELKNRFQPKIIAEAVIELAQTTASYLTAGNKDRSKRVLLGADDHPQAEAVRAARLHLVDAVRNTIRHGLELLGVQAPEAM